MSRTHVRPPHRGKKQYCNGACVLRWVRKSRLVSSKLVRLSTAVTCARLECCTPYAENLSRVERWIRRVHLLTLQFGTRVETDGPSMIGTRSQHNRPQLYDDSTTAVHILSQLTTHSSPVRVCQLRRLHHVVEPTSPALRTDSSSLTCATCLRTTVASLRVVQ